MKCQLHLALISDVPKQLFVQLSHLTNMDLGPYKVRPILCTLGNFIVNQLLISAY